VALALGSLTGGGGTTTNPTAGALPPLNLPAPPHVTAEAGPCTKLLEALPVTVDGLDPRVVHTTPDTPYVVAWGDPPIVLSCGANRPKGLTPTSGDEFVVAGPRTGPYYDVQPSGSANVWTTVDRGPYVSIEVPAKYQGADALPALSRAIAGALPAVCVVDDTAPAATNCVNRK
jgi:hypothetical protein